MGAKISSIVSFILAPKNNKIKQTRSTEKNKILKDAAEPVRSPVMAFDRKFTSKLLIHKRTSSVNYYRLVIFNIAKDAGFSC